MTKDNKSIKLGPLSIELLHKIKGSESSENQRKHNQEMQDLFNKLQAESEEGNRKFKEKYTVKSFEPINFNFLELSLDDIKKLSSNDLLKLLSSDGHSGEISPSTLQLISNELLMRQIKESSKHHWTTVPAFILLIVTLILTTLTSLKPISDFYSEVFNRKDDHTNKGEQIKENSKP